MAQGQLNLTNQFGEQSLNNIDPIGGSGGPEFQFASGAGLYSGAGAPSFAAAPGSMYLRTDGTAATCLYINPTDGNNWVPIVSA